LSFLGLFEFFRFVWVF